MNDSRRHIEQAGKALAGVRKKLLHPSPETMQECLPSLENAVRLIQLGEAGLRNEMPPPERQRLRHSVAGLHRELKQVAALFEQAHQFYSFWARSIAGESSVPAYTPAGAITSQPVRSAGESRLLLHG